MIYIEKDDFLEVPPNKFFRLSPGKEVRLRSGYFIKCIDFTKDPATGEITELRCTYDPETRGGSTPPDGRKVKGTLHWVSETHSLPAEIRLYDRLFNVEFPGQGDSDYLKQMNPHSLVTLTKCRVEPGLAQAGPETRYQFERQGYFCVDRHDSKPGHLVFNRTVTLKDSWLKEQSK